MALRNWYQAESELFRSVSLGDANSLSVKAFNLKQSEFSLHDLSQNLDSEESQRTQKSLGENKPWYPYTVMLMETSVSLSSWRVLLLLSRVSQVSSQLLWSRIFKAGHGTPSLSAVERLCYISCRQIFVNSSANTVFAKCNGNVLSFWLSPKAIFAVNHLLNLLGI